MRVILTAVIVIVLLAIAAPHSSAQGECNQCTSKHCYKSDSPPWSWSLPTESSSYFDFVVIKAGTECITIRQNGTDGCYLVQGIGTKSISISKVGSGPDCKDISHVLYYWWSPALPTQTPSPTPTIPPSTDTPEPTATATLPPDEPSPTSTVTNTPPPDASPTPTATATKPPPTPTITPQLGTPVRITPTATNPPATPTKPPGNQVAFVYGYLECVWPDGSITGAPGEYCNATSDVGIGMGGSPRSQDNSFIGMWPIPKDSGVTVTSLECTLPGSAYRVGDDYSTGGKVVGPLFDGVNNQFSGHVGTSGWLWRGECGASFTFEIEPEILFLPETGKSFLERLAVIIFDIVLNHCLVR